MKSDQYRIDREQLAQIILSLKEIEVKKSDWTTSKNDSGHVHKSIVETCAYVDTAKDEFSKLVRASINYFEKVKLSEEKNAAIATKAVRG